MYSYTLSLTSAVDGDGVDGQRHAPVTLPSYKNLYTLCKRLSGRQGRSGRLRKISRPPEYDSRTVQPVASRYTH